MIEQQEFIPGTPTMDLGGLTIPPLIIGNPAHLFLPCLRKTYTGQLDHRKEFLNY